MDSTKPFRIKALNQLEFEGAVSDGYVYGTVSKYVRNRWQAFYVFAWLGKSVNYQVTSKDDPNASYKKFINCTIRISETQVELDAEEFFSEESGLSLVIYW